jgi:hypothetical protein
MKPGALAMRFYRLSACSLMLDSHAGMVKFVPAYDVISTPPN